MFTIDPFYDVKRYNESLEALKNNSIAFNEYISIKYPYNFYIETSQNPILMNYNELTEQQKRFIVRKVEPIQPNDEYILFRRNDSKNGNIAKYINNKPLQDAENSQFACFFHLKNYNQAITISKEYPGKLWFFGKYLKNRYNIFLATNETILLFIPIQNVLIKKDALNIKEFKEPGRFETELNYKIFLKQDFLKKYSDTPFFENGFFYRPKNFNFLNF